MRFAEETATNTDQSINAPRVLYRVTKTPTPVEVDFQSNLQRCRIPVPIERADPGVWAGLSAYDTLAGAEATARYYGFRIGRFVAELRFPAEASVVPSRSNPDRFSLELHRADGRVHDVVLAARTGGPPGHYTLWGCAPVFLQLAVNVRAVPR